MSEKKLKIKLLPNGEIQMETHGVKGKKCLDNFADNCPIGLCFKCCLK